MIRDKLLRKLVRWTPGDAYDEAELDRLRRSLVGLDYFGLVEVSPKPGGRGPQARAGADRPDPGAAQHLHHRPELRHRKRAGRALGVERRYLNSPRGHKALAQVDYARDRKRP